MAEKYIRPFYLESKAIPVVNLSNDDTAISSLLTFQKTTELADNEFFRKRLLQLEEE